jgi:uncharacterized protein YigE (DUF2233 family)
MINPIYFLFVFATLFPKEFNPEPMEFPNLRNHKSIRKAPNFILKSPDDSNFSKKETLGYHVANINSNYSIHYYLTNSDSTVKILPKSDEYNNFSSLKNKIPNAVFMMNAGMFHPNYEPVGLLISQGKLIKEIESGFVQQNGNFYMYPNGIFAINKDGKAVIAQTEDYKRKHYNLDSISFATQSGPMLVINNNIHPKFGKNSMNVNIRNGVGINYNGQIIFAISEKPINFYDFALFFRDYLKCPNALYLDGAISDMYYIEGKSNFNTIKSSTKFGPIIVISK